jgi:hypothetical protein
MTHCFNLIYILAYKFFSICVVGPVIREDVPVNMGRRAARHRGYGMRIRRSITIEGFTTGIFP